MTSISPALGFRRSAVLVGDSITENAAAVDGWAAAVAHCCTRRVDVFNRGLGGYTTRTCLAVLERILPQTDTGLFATVFFGANDAAMNEQQHVPLQEYEANLRAIVAILQRWAPHIIVISPPPVIEELRPNRNNQRIKEYTEACRRVAADTSSAFVNLYEAFEAKGDWTRFLSDGLHLSAEGNSAVAEALLPVITPLLEWVAVDVPKWGDVSPDPTNLLSVEALARLPYLCGRFTKGTAIAANVE